VGLEGLFSTILQAFQSAFMEKVVSFFTDLLGQFLPLSQ
jgi:hypothetical protein